VDCITLKKYLRDRIRFKSGARITGSAQVQSVNVNELIRVEQDEAEIGECPGSGIDFVGLEVAFGAEELGTEIERTAAEINTCRI
jgi:hypothetical protein